MCCYSVIDCMYTVPLRSRVLLLLLMLWGVGCADAVREKTRATVTVAHPSSILLTYYIYCTCNLLTNKTKGLQLTLKYDRGTTLYSCEIDISRRYVLEGTRHFDLKLEGAADVARRSQSTLLHRHPRRSSFGALRFQLQSVSRALERRVRPAGK